MSTQDDDDIFCFEEEVEAGEGGTRSGSHAPPWKVLMIDDSPEVHQVTRMVLRSTRFLDRPIEFLSAYSAAEGRELIRQNTDAALVFLDVVMETDHAGLDMVKYIREEVGNKLIRIILRTGQPGQAPEADVIQQYDINDYKDKTELSDDRLLTTLIVALRSYNDLLTIEESRRGLEQILESSTELAQVRSTEMFLSGLLKQLQAMFNFGQDAVLCARSKPGTDRPILPNPKVLAGAGQFERMIGDGLDVDSIVPYKDYIRRAFESGKNSFDEGNYSIYFYSRDVFEIVILLDSPREPTQFDNTLINVFCNTAAVSLSNINLLETLEQKIEERTDALMKANLELQKMATIDVLTEAFNRRNLFELGNEQLRVARRYKRPLSLMIFDVDHFKSINDTHGHASGDAVLKGIAKYVKSLLRTADIFARYGGEEFVIVLPETEIAGALIVGERLRHGVETLKIEEVPALQNVTVSVGITDFHQDDSDIAKMIQRADNALYDAKRGGRNKVVCFQAG